MNEEDDIFDLLMGLPLIRIFNPFYKKYKEILLYLFFGGLTFVISVTTYIFFDVTCKLNELLANVFSWIIAVTFAYITNQNYVFKAYKSNMKLAFRQMWNFFCARILTLVLEELIIYIFITCMHYNSIIIKITAQIVVIIANYFLSKWYIFKK